MLEEAITHYREALRIQPDYAEAHYSLANALARQGELEEAELHYQEAVRIRPALRNQQPGPKTTGK
jgi:tetratricopeptide (TPR) repeat protein